MNNLIRLRIALAEDDSDQQIFSEAVAECNVQAELILFNDGEDLLTWLDSTGNPPSLLFMDLNMPRKNGFECLRHIRSIENLKNMPVVIYSTSRQSADIKKAYSEGADLYFTKPYSYGNLSKNLNKIMGMDLKKLHAKSLDSFVIG